MQNYPQYHERDLIIDPHGQSPIFHWTVLTDATPDIVWTMLSAEIDRRFADVMAKYRTPVQVSYRTWEDVKADLAKLAAASQLGRPR